MMSRRSQAKEVGDVKFFNLCIHSVSGVVIVVNSLILLTLALTMALLSVMFHGNGIGLMMILSGVAMLVAGIKIFKTGIADARLMETDLLLYRSQEIRMYLIAAVIFVLSLLVLFLFNSFSVEEVFKYGYGFELFINGGLLILTVVGLVLTMNMAH